MNRDGDRYSSAARKASTISNGRRVDRVGIIRLAPILAGIVLGLSLILAGWAFLRDKEHAAAAERENTLIVSAGRLLSLLKDVETGERGFIITGKDEYLEPYNWGRAAVPPDPERVSALIGEASRTLSNLVDARMAEAARVSKFIEQPGPLAEQHPF